ncbi:MAG: ATP-binding protein [Bacteroidales bacterium]|jgi:predicted AAA+ superfamily ATPase|nr:ATP-binding protein [Bacteroidales bacterium]
MYRNKINELKQWKLNASKKPLIIRGSRQVGKTWLMREFARTEYEDFIYVNFEQEKTLRDKFKGNLYPRELIKMLEIQYCIRPRPEKTLIIFDEIQEAERGLTSLKYFCEDAPEYHIVCAGSLLGITMHKQVSFPVGKVNFLDLYPLTFTEFLEATGEKSLSELVQTKDFTMITAFKAKLIDCLKRYFFIGGMPEVVAKFAENQDYREVSDIQNIILDTYRKDFSKHAPKEIIGRIELLWNSIPSQLAKENRKFVYANIAQGARAREYELAMAWLLDCGLIHKIHRVTKAGYPLKAYQDFSAFKLYLNDIGLMSAMTNIDVKVLLEGSAIFEEFKGSLTEQFVLQQLVTNKKLAINYWSAENSKAEIDLLVQHEDQIVPIEVKAAENLQAKSLRSFCEKYKPQNAIRTSL